MRRDGIEDEARSLREAVRGLCRNHPTAEIPHELRSQIMTLAARAKVAGWSMATVARAVGVSLGSIRNWRRAQGGVALVPVTVAANREVPSSGLRVVGPSGYRVEGLDVATTAMLLRALE
jgi:hypothetical protein